MAQKVRYTQPLFGEANAAGYLILVPGASVLIRQDGVACSVYADNAGAAMTNPVPTGVPTGTAGVDTNGTLLVYLDAGNGYDGQATVGAAVSTFPIPDISPDVADVADTRAAPNVWFPEDYAEDGTGGILAALTAALASGSENIIIQLQERTEANPYLISGALKTDREGNAQIPLPFVAYPNNGPAITIQGPTPMDNYFPGGGQKGAIIESTLSGATFSATNGAPSVIGGPTYQNSLSGGQPRFTYLNVTLRNLVVVVPAGAPLGGIDLDLVGRVDLDSVAVFAKRTGFTADFSDAFTDPGTNYHGFGIRMPRAGNYGKCRLGKTGTYGVYAGLITNEHSDVRHHISKWCKIGWVPSTGTPGHAMTATKIGTEWCTYSVSGWSEETGVASLTALTEIDALLDIERPPTGGNYAGKFYQPVTIVNDPADLLAGELRYYAGDGSYAQIGTSWRLRQRRLRTFGIDVQGRLDHKDWTPTSIPNVVSSTAYALDPTNLILNFRAPLNGRVSLYWELFAAVAATTNLEVGWFYSSGGVSTGVQVFPTMEYASNGGGLYLCTSRRRTKTDFTPGTLYEVMLAVRNTAGSGTIAIPNDNIHIEAMGG